MGNKKILTVLGALCLMMSTTHCGAGTQRTDPSGNHPSASQGAASGDTNTTATENTADANHASNANSVDANAIDGNAPTLNAVFFQDSNLLYLSTRKLSCDSNIVAAGQSTVRLWMRSVTSGSDYNMIVGEAYTSPDKGQGMEFSENALVMDANCKDVTSNYAPDKGIGTLPYFDIVSIQDAGADAKAVTGLLRAGTSPNTAVGKFSAIMCPAGSADPFLPNYNDHCALPESCTPIAVVCE